MIPTNDLLKLTEFVLKNIFFFEFNNKIKQQISGVAIETKFTPPYTCIYMNKIEIYFLKMQTFQPFVWLRYIDEIFFIWTHGEAEQKTFIEGVINFFVKPSIYI